MSNIRLYINQALHVGEQILFSEEDSHYLCNVMRLKDGEEILCFNGKEGEFRIVLTQVNKKTCEGEVLSQTQPFRSSPDIWLLFAPVKKDKTDFIIEKATELGVNKIIPVITQRTISDKVKTERFCAQAKEAAEQCRRLDVPQIEDAVSLEKYLTAWPKERALFFMDESGEGISAKEAFLAHQGKPAAILVGPEGGFAKEEMEKIRQKEQAVSVTLGPRILRAETAVAAALSVWQATVGDWNEQGEKD